MGNSMEDVAKILESLNQELKEFNQYLSKEIKEMKVVLANLQETKERLQNLN